MLEKMADFFEKRLSEYDSHMLNEIDGAREFYPFTAAMLPSEKEAKILDLGAGTGLELEYYFALNPTAEAVCIDLSSGMLANLKTKLSGFNVKTICGSYFEAEFANNEYDAVVSVESLHHFTAAQKTALYKKICRTLKPGGCFILTDYFALSEKEEQEYRMTLENIMKAECAAENVIYHYDTPLTVENETLALINGGFSSVERLRSWGATVTLRARK